MLSLKVGWGFILSVFFVILYTHFPTNIKMFKDGGLGNPPYSLLAVLKLVKKISC